ncbi:hypothetical protein E5358_12745 [Palleniella muris]|uniref:Uncharacterized protein n=1 Tax=Palleniella muris TaxID=3038145 RepID=A0AC61QMM5_9BACT|nr:hypothetical protein [Palleniella muris]TGX80518.1 hypothetical protein E5358_12745 [Palleniella muris]
MRLAFENKKVRDYIQRNYEVFEDILPLMYQPRSAGIHASAVIVVPEYVKGQKVECFNVLPVRKMDGLLVSEISGNDVDAIGLLKNDVLGIVELERIADVLRLIQQNYGKTITIDDILNGDLNNQKVYQLIRKGLTQGVFQMSGDGITRYIMGMRPDNINDLIASVALFRPGTLDSGAAAGYVKCKNGQETPEYLWSTYDILKDTFGYMCYQEQISQTAQKIGSLSLADGVNLVKALSKKKLEKVRKFKDKYFDGAKKNGCPKEAAERIWSNVEDAAKYSFNKCICGDEYLWGRHKTHGNKNAITIAEAYKTMNDLQWAKRHNKLSLRSKYLRCGYGTCWSLNAEKRLVINRVKDIRYEGVRPVYRITLETGETIDVTSNHRHPTVNGIKRTDELIVGVDEMYVRAGYVKEDTCYRFTDKGRINNTAYHSNANVEHYTYNSRVGHEGFIHRDTAYTRLKYYKNNLMKNYCEECGAENCRLEIHHINGCHGIAGENFNNLQTLCVSCHKKKHYVMGRTKMGCKGIYTRTSKIIAIDYVGKKDVYDVEMEAPYHTFTTGNGVVTHNSHATAYGLTGYIGAWLKTYYPTAFYTVILKHQKEKELPKLMREMKIMGGTTIVAPDINVSGTDFITDFNTGNIHWSLSRIKQLGVRGVKYIMEDRDKFGPYTSIEEFIDRIFKYKLKKYQYWDDPDTKEQYDRCPVNARGVKHLIIAGAFDKVENVLSVVERYGILARAASHLGFVIKPTEIPEDLRDKHYFWSEQQIKLSGMGEIDYERIFNEEKAPHFIFYPLSALNTIYEQSSQVSNPAICATITEVSEKSFKDKKTGETKHFGKVQIRQNTDIATVILWPDAWEAKRDIFTGKVGHMVISGVMIKYSDYEKKLAMNITPKSYTKIL